jgi:hypothetical protein
MSTGDSSPRSWRCDRPSDTVDDPSDFDELIRDGDRINKMLEIAVNKTYEFAVDYRGAIVVVADTLLIRVELALAEIDAIMVAYRKEKQQEG